MTNNPKVKAISSKAEEKYRTLAITLTIEQREKLDELLKVDKQLAVAIYRHNYKKHANNK